MFSLKTQVVTSSDVYWHAGMHRKSTKALGAFGDVTDDDVIGDDVTHDAIASCLSASRAATRLEATESSCASWDVDIIRRPWRKCRCSVPLETLGYVGFFDTASAVLVFVFALRPHRQHCAQRRMRAIAIRNTAKTYLCKKFGQYFPENFLMNFYTPLHREAEKRNHFSFMNKTF